MPRRSDPASVSPPKTRKNESKESEATSAAEAGTAATGRGFNFTFLTFLAIVFPLALTQIFYLTQYPYGKMAASDTKRIEDLAKTYFKVWSDHNVDELATLFNDKATLRDWDIEKSGKDDVVAANAGIFKAVPGIYIDIKNIFVSKNENTGGTPVAACEILVNIAKEKGGKVEEVLKVTDVIEFDNDGKITAVRAYKG